MAGAKPGVHIVQLKKINVVPALVQGHKFVKWDEDSGTATPVNLTVDPNGFFLIWENQNKEVDLLDISSIRDTRNGRGAKLPKDPKLRQLVTIGSTQDSLEDKTLTIASGADYVNVTFINFCCTSKEVAQLWTDELLKMAYNLLQLNGSVMSFLLKIHTKIQVQVDPQNRISIKNVVKTFAQKEDREKVERALDAAGQPSSKNDTINPTQFTFEEFFTFYKHLTIRPEVEKVFDDFSGFAKTKLMTAEQFTEFLNKEQRDPRLNEILYPYTTPERAKDLIEQYETNSFNSTRGLLSFDGFLRYVLSEDNSIISMNRYDLSDDLSQPLNHYFINSSHNTYLTGHQLAGKSSVEIYRQSLLSGCRCVELDFWNGRFDEPNIVHGYTLVPDIPAKDVIEAIAESAFKTSDLPVILSFENHCNQRQQAKIAQYCHDYFGEMLLDVPLDSHPLSPGVQLPPPELLKRRILIKNKKKHGHHHSKKAAPVKKMSRPVNSSDETGGGTGAAVATVENNGGGGGGGGGGTGDLSGDSDGYSSSSDDDSAEPDDLPQSDKGTAGKESQAGAEISALVNYVQPVHFHSFEHALNRSKAYEMTSFDEKQAMALLRERPVEFVNYNKNQLTRVYPKGTRVDSSNFMPQLFWNAGCQLVALNYQTLDLGMQLNIGIFEQNGRSGYLLKPECMRRKERKFDPFAENTVDGIIAGTVHVRVISGQFLSDKRVGTYVEVEMYGLPTDTVRRRFRTKTISLNGINPVYDEEPFIFKKVVLPDLACLRIAAYEESGKLIGHRVLPVIGLRPGFRHCVLRNELGQPLLPTLFLQIKVQDFVPDGLSDLAEALANPIKHQSEREKREKQMCVLQDDAGLEEEEDSTADTCTPDHTAGAGGGASGPTRTLSTKSAIVTKKTSLDQQQTSPIATTTHQHHHQPPPKPTKSDSVEKEQTEYLVAATLDVQPETLDKFWECKIIREKRLELEKKIEALRRKHEKDRTKGPRKGHQKLVKRISSKNLEVGVAFTKDAPPNLKLINEQLLIEKDLQEKGYEEIFTLLEKTVRTSQSNQLKLLTSLETKDTAEVMKKISSNRKDEVRKLSKRTKEKNELDRLKREVTSRLVEKGVNERAKMEKTYAKYREQLIHAHADVLKKLEEKREKIVNELDDEWKCRLKELNAGGIGGGGGGVVVGGGVGGGNGNGNVEESKL